MLLVPLSIQAPGPTCPNHRGYCDGKHHHSPCWRRQCAHCQYMSPRITGTTKSGEGTPPSHSISPWGNATTTKVSESKVVRVSLLQSTRALPGHTTSLLVARISTEISVLRCTSSSTFPPGTRGLQGSQSLRAAGQQGARVAGQQSRAAGLQAAGRHGCRNGLAAGLQASHGNKAAGFEGQQGWLQGSRAAGRQ